MPIIWRKSYETGIEEIDKQHQEIFDRANSLIQINKNFGIKEGVEEAERVIDFLNEYIITHFSDEEQLQLKYDYPEYRNHKNSHNKFIQKIEEFNVDFKEGENTLTNLSKLNAFVLKWLIRHIGSEDNKLAQYIKDQQ
ncbi:bacteriohemerythrin [Halonatronum saccharophilum]|uniref:bacteriohemerythrin n=1 Tax=Halonatronum saccharophilum TaxID=150060 RepID=UPI0004BC2957|nr:bacteriohemerythrin [Halonatronum saccharophilum]